MSWEQARASGCTCTWMRGFGVDDGAPEVWTSRIMELDDDCPVHKPLAVACWGGSIPSVMSELRKRP